MAAVGNEKFYSGYDNSFNLRHNHHVLRDTKRRIDWFGENYELCYGKLPREEVPRGARVLWEEIRKRRAETAQSTPRHFLPKKVTPPLPVRNETILMDPMKPVPEKVHALIYQGISHEEEGKYLYLKTRYKEAPEDKYYLTDCSNWIYGWNIQEVELHKLYRVPRIQIIKASFYRRGGVERDPDHYRNPVNVEAPMFFPQL